MFVTCISRSLDSFKLLSLFLGFAILIFSSLVGGYLGMNAGGFRPQGAGGGFVLGLIRQGEEGAAGEQQESGGAEETHFNGGELPVS